MITLPEIVRDVKKVINEAGDEEEAILITEDKVNLDLYVESAVSSSVAFIQRLSPIKNVNPKSATLAAVDNKDGTGYVVCPDDYVGLIGMKMSKWNRICVVAYPEGSEMWAQQMNQYTRSGPNKPCCIEGYSPEGKKIISYFSIPKGQEHSVTLFRYESAFDGNEGLNCTNEFLYKAVVYKAASLVYQMFQDENTSQALEREALKYISVEGQNQGNA